MLLCPLLVVKRFVLVLVIAVVVSCAPAQPAQPAQPLPSTSSKAPAVVPSTMASPHFTAEQRLRADRIVSVFENGTIEIRYDYVERLSDGRGYTAGRGFTTGTGDVLAVIEDYAKRSPRNALERYLPALRKLAAAHSDAIIGLEGFPGAWTKAAKSDPIFRKCQDDEVDRSSFSPAMEIADGLGLKTALGRFAIYDAIFMHGPGDDPDGLPALVKAATRDAHGAPKDGASSEPTWLLAFVRARRATLVHAHDPSTRAEWAKAVGRADVFLDLLAAKNFDLRGPIHLGADYDVDVP